MQIGNGEKCKTLGLAWSVSHDALTYSIENSPQDTHITKRMVLSHISQIFDPLGLVAPCTVSIVDSLNITSSTTEANIMQIGNGEKCKTLGLAWSVGHDALTYSIENSPQDTHITKRMVLSHISQIFDPLGLVAPCTVIAKVMLQKLWMEKVAWDEVVPDSIACGG
ncbi:Pao retrotransposon peptidase [Popillia japonica]|uniref:Pao retrotransposon peptidase n=1 Tax=Popillia japonica TaxID=7064 RepID=A0AAW1JME5_POPJA